MELTTSEKINNTCSKWLLAIAVLLVFITFSGVSAVSQNRQSTVQTTILVVKHREQISQKLSDLTFKKVYKKRTGIFLLSSVLNLSRAHNKQAITDFKLHSGSILLHTITRIFYRVKVTPQGDENEPAVS